MKVISGTEWKKKYGRVGYKAKTTEQIIADIVGVMEGALTGQVKKRTGALWKYDAATKKAVCRITYGTRTLCAVTDLEAKNEEEAKKRFGEVIEKIKERDKVIMAFMTSGIEEVRSRLASVRAVKSESNM